MTNTSQKQNSPVLKITNQKGTRTGRTLETGLSWQGNTEARYSQRWCNEYIIVRCLALFGPISTSLLLPPSHTHCYTQDAALRYAFDASQKAFMMIPDP